MLLLDHLSASLGATLPARERCVARTPPDLHPTDQLSNCTTRHRAPAHYAWTIPRQCARSEEHTSELQSQSNLVCRLLLDTKNTYDDSPILVHQYEPLLVVVDLSAHSHARTVRFTQSEHFPSRDGHPQRREPLHHLLMHLI